VTEQGGGEERVGETPAAEAVLLDEREASARASASVATQSTFARPARAGRGERLGHGDGGSKRRGS